MRAYIYSVNIFPVTCEVGSFGNYVINPRGANEKVARTEIDDRKYMEDNGDQKFTPRIQPAIEIAQDIVTRNPGLGMFLSEHAAPTEEEIRVAQDALDKADAKRIRLADSIWETKRNRELINNEARNGCKRLKITREWLDSVADTKTKTCRGCKNQILPDAIICEKCGWNQLVDPAEAAKAQLAEYAAASGQQVPAGRQAGR